MTLHAPFDLEYWLVNVFSGNWNIFTFISILAIVGICAKFKIPMMAFIGIIVIYGGILMAAGASGLMILIISIVGPLLFWAIRKLLD